MAFYLFPGVMRERFNQLSSSKRLMDQSEEVEIYNLCTRQYWGMGALLQFIPGTNANLARRQLTKVLSDEIKNEIEECRRYGADDWASWFEQQRKVASLRSYLNFAPIFALFLDINRGFHFDEVTYTKKITFDEFIVILPLFKEFFMLNYWSSTLVPLPPSRMLINLWFLLINPLKLIDDTLDFLHLVINRAIDMGSTTSLGLNITRAIAKGIISLAFGLLKAPVKLLKHGIDLVETAFYAVLIKPLLHVLQGISSTFTSRESVLIAHVKTFQDMRALRKQAEEAKEAKEAKEAEEAEGKPQDLQAKAYRRSTYFFTKKEEVYTSTDPEKLAALKSDYSKIQKMHGLFSIVTAKKHQEIDFTSKLADDHDCIQEAKKVLARFG